MRLLQAALQRLLGQGDEGRDVARVDVVDALEGHLHLEGRREGGKEGKRARTKERG